MGIGSGSQDLQVRFPFFLRAFQGKSGAADAETIRNGSSILGYSLYRLENSEKHDKIKSKNRSDRRKEGWKRMEGTRGMQRNSGS